MQVERQRGKGPFTLSPFCCGRFPGCIYEGQAKCGIQNPFACFFSRVLVRMWFLFTLRAWFSNSHLNLTVFCELLLTLHLIPWTNRILSLFLPSCSFLVPYSSRSTPSSSSSSSSFFLLHFLVLIYFSFSLPSLNPPLFTPYLFFFFFHP